MEDPLPARLLQLLQWPTVSRASAEELGKLTVLDESGEVVPVSSLWADTTAVLVFVRHFG